MTDTHTDLAPPLPARMARLPRDRHGRPVPWFVAWVDGVPDFRVIGAGRLADAHRFGLCWVCGLPTGAYKAAVIGPMCAVNRVSSEPPSHRACAVWSARNCPFMASPSMRRRTTGLPEDATDPAGIGLKRNPGVALVWVTRRVTRVPAPGGHLFNLGDPVEVLWFAQGRPATRGEVLASIDSGLPTLQAMADEDGPRAVAALARMTTVALRLVPA